MFNKIDKKKGSKGFINTALAVIVFLLSVTGAAVTVSAQELSNEEAQAALMQYTLKYRFGKDLKSGDWVRYGDKGGEGEIELKVTGEESGHYWLTEKFHGTEIVYMIDLNRVELIKATVIDEDGDEFEIRPMSPGKLNEIMGMMKSQMEQQGSYAQFVAWKKDSGTEEIVVPAGSFSCAALKPEYSEEYAGRVEDYKNQLQQQGKSEAEINEMVYGNEPGLYFSSEVPRLLPMQIAIGWIPFIESFDEVTGGLVECRHMQPLKLTGYGGH